MESNAILRRAIEKYGQEHQMVVAIEELSELQKELCKYLRYGLDTQRVENIAEEIADVEIMLEQVKIMLVCHVPVTKQRRAKLPKVGDRFRKTPTLCIPDHKPAPAMCEVVYVNAAHLWYTVEFKVRGSRFRECYKLPEVKG